VTPPAPRSRWAIGRSILRTEDPPLLTGQGVFVDDIDRPGQLWARVVRSQAAHAQIRAVRTDVAARAPGVQLVITAADLPDVRIPIRLLPTEEAERVLQPPLARDTVRYVGEPLAVVVADGAYQAEDAAEDVEVELEPLEPTLDPVRASESTAPRLHSGRPNVINELRAVHGEDVAELFARASVVVRDTLRVERNTAIPIEPRGLIAELGDDGLITMWGPAKVKHFNREVLARLLGIPVDRLRFIEPDVGGGFGVRGEFYPEDFLIPWLARRLGRPVKWIEDRAEHFVAANHARDQHCEIEVAADAEGRLLALRSTLWVDQGAYARTHGGLLLPLLALHHLPGPYRWLGFDLVARSVLTNKTPSGTYRGPSQYEPTFFRERMIDRVAARLAFDPAKLRAINLIPAGDLPYRVSLGADDELLYDSGDYPYTLETLLDHASYRETRRELESRRSAGEFVGVGIAAYVEEGGIGPYETARIVPDSTGGFTVHVGIAALGQGVRTALAQIAADALGVEVEQVEISHRDTQLVAEGFGAFASRSTALGGGAIAGAAGDLERRARDAAAAMLDVDGGALEVDLAYGVRLRDDLDWIPLSALRCHGEHRYEPDALTMSMGVSLAVVEVDRDTLVARVRRVIVCHDIGRMVNPMMVRGQIVGAAAQAAGGALLERLSYDDAGQPLTTSFMDFAMPTAVEIPPIECIVLELSSEGAGADNPLGIKGCGESGIIGTGAAIANAVCDAIGADLSALPIMPEQIAALLSGAGRLESDPRKICPGSRH
jgi:carbon-monoxide dehydrogenase large subunit